MTIARYTNPEKTGIFLYDGDGSHGIFAEPTGAYSELYEQAMAGKFGEIEPYVPPPPPTDEEVAAEVRAERNRLLAESDWTQLPDVPEALRVAWAAYRQELRDIPQQAGFPHDVVWPEKP